MHLRVLIDDDISISDWNYIGITATRLISKSQAAFAVITVVVVIRPISACWFLRYIHVSAHVRGYRVLYYQLTIIVYHHRVTLFNIGGMAHTATDDVMSRVSHQYILGESGHCLPRLTSDTAERTAQRLIAR